MEVAEKKRKITNSYTCYNSFIELAELNVRTDFDWFLLMIYWRTDAFMMLPLTIFCFFIV